MLVFKYPYIDLDQIKWTPKKTDKDGYCWELLLWKIHTCQPGNLQIREIRRMGGGAVGTRQKKTVVGINLLFVRAATTSIMNMTASKIFDSSGHTGKRNNTVHATCVIKGQKSAVCRDS